LRDACTILEKQLVLNLIRKQPLRKKEKRKKAAKDNDDKSFEFKNNLAFFSQVNQLNHCIWQVDPCQYKRKLVWSHYCSKHIDLIWEKLGHYKFNINPTIWDWSKEDDILRKEGGGFCVLLFLCSSNAGGFNGKKMALMNLLLGINKFINN
jgi:hypothetical protein